MNLIEFFEAVEADAELQGVGIDAAKRILSVASTRMPNTTTCFSVGAVEKDEVDWDLLKAILHGEREPEVLYHMSRVVGYYSRISNWSQSKIGELRDRVKGDYALDGTRRDRDATLGVIELQYSKG